MSQTGGWWYLLLNNITGRKGTQVTRKKDEYEKWSTWYIAGADLKKLPA